MGVFLTLVSMLIAALQAAATGITNEPVVSGAGSRGYLERKFGVDFRDPQRVAAARKALLGTRLTAVAAMGTIVLLWWMQPENGLKAMIHLVFG